MQHIFQQLPESERRRIRRKAQIISSALLVFGVWTSFFNTGLGFIYWPIGVMWMIFKPEMQFSLSEVIGMAFTWFMHYYVIIIVLAFLSRHRARRQKQIKSPPTPSR